MGKLAVLKFGQGSFESGFSVTLRLGQEGESATLELDGQLPTTPTLLELAQTWRFCYRSRGNLDTVRQLQVPKAQTTRRRSSLVAVSQDWVEGMNQWLNSSDRGFQPIRDQLLKLIAQGDEVRLVIQAEQAEIWQLPWHLWDVVQDHPNIDVTFSLGTFAKPDTTSHPPHPQIRILVLLGDSTNIDIQTDLQVLIEQLPDAEIYIPTQVQREQLCHDLWQQSWDILFFAGHSSSHLNEGRFYLTPEVFLTIDDLRYALRRAITNGLQLAIFNSCDGLALARCLADLNLPAAIVMRERIPDEAAQKFLHYFLESFAHSQRSLHLAVRDAREKLHTALDNKYPCASWLPLVYQSPVSSSLNWQILHSNSVQTDQTYPQFIDHQQSFNQKLPTWKTTVMIGCAFACVVLGFRMQGVMQPLELKAYDHLIQQRPIEGADPRILVIGITEADVNEQTRNREVGKGSLSDETLQKLLMALDQHQPKIIGLDLLRDHPISDNFQTLKKRLSRDQRPSFIAICQFNGRYEGSVSSPPEVPLSRIGFNDVPQDRDKMTRLHLLTAQDTTSPCQASQSFALQLALHFLQYQGIFPEKLPDGSLKLNKTIFKRLGQFAGGYQNEPWVNDNFNQILINYRPYERLKDIADTVSLQAVLDGKVKPEKIKDRIILIGRVDTDTWITPYRVWEVAQDGTPGVYVHAQIVSQILSATLDQRALIWWFPIWLDALWIIVWGILGSILIRYSSRVHTYKTIAILVCISGAVLILYLSSLLAIQFAGWIPLIPPLISLTLSSFGVLVYQQLQPYLQRTLSPSQQSSQIQ